MSSSEVPDRMQVDPSPARQSRISIRSLVSREHPSTPQSQLPLQTQESKPVKAPLQSELCPNCGESINIADADGNETGLWEIHSMKCGQASPAPSDASSASLIEDTTPFRRYKVRVNEEERQAAFSKDKQVKAIKEYQALCAFCDTWVQLRKDRPFCSIAWTEHKLTCRRRQPVGTKLSPKPTSSTRRSKREHTASSVVPMPPSDSTSMTPSSASLVPSRGSPSFTPHQGSVPPPTFPSTTLPNASPSSNHPRRSDPDPARAKSGASDCYNHTTSPPQIRRTESERVKLLISDPNATTVEAHRVLCAVCGRWIQLRKNSTYCTAPWIQHVSKCVKRNGPHSGVSRSAHRNSTMTSAAGTAQSLRQATPSGSRVSAEQQRCDDEPESDPDAEVEDVPRSSSRRPRGRPRKRRAGHLNPPSQQGQTTALGRRSFSPIPMPSPPPSHPYPGHRYVYLSNPPTQPLLNFYTDSQYSPTGDSYAMYFDAESIPSNVLSQLNLPPFPLGDGKRWIVYQLQNYEKNGCPIDPVTVKAAEMDGDGGEIEGRNVDVDVNPKTGSPQQQHGLDNVNAGERVNPPRDVPSPRSGNWSPHSVTEEEGSLSYHSHQGQQQQQNVRLSPSLSSSHTPRHGGGGGSSQQEGAVSSSTSSNLPSHKPAVPIYESPRLPREAYRSPHIDLLCPIPKPQPVSPPVLPPAPPSPPLPPPTPPPPPPPLSSSSVPRPPRRNYYSGTEDEPLFHKETKQPYISPPPLPPPPPPAPIHPQFSPMVAPDIYTAPPLHLPPIPPPPPPPSVPYVAASDPSQYHPYMPAPLRKREHHSPTHAHAHAPMVVVGTPQPAFRPTPPRYRDRDRERDELPLPQSPPQYDTTHVHTPGSSVHHSTPGMGYRSPHIFREINDERERDRERDRDDRRSSSFSKLKRLRHSRSRSRSRSRARSRSRSPKTVGPPPRPIPTSMARVSPEARLFYTHGCIAYLFQTSLKGAVDIPLMTLMTFMNEGFGYRDGRSSHFTFEEVRDCVAELGRRQMLIFTKEGGVQLGEV